ncbi:MAG: response regulator [Lachnospiraceae bacterium]|nr:response regulator [Lachnospiraceae bacterium]
MNEEIKNIVILVLQYSVVVKGIERKLNDAKFQTTVLTDSFDRIRDMSGTTDLFILYLPGDCSNKADVLEKLVYICDQVKRTGRNMIMIGEANDHPELVKKAHVISDFPWLDRPIEMDVLRPAIEAAIEGKTVSVGKKRILIVDDDPSYAKMVREWIKSDYQTSVVTAGMQAITFLLKNPVDMILLDYEMPVVDGPQVLQMLRQEPATAKIPVIFLTGVGTKDAVERVMALKPDGYVLKSTTRENLLKYLRGKVR